MECSVSVAHWWMSVQMQNDYTYCQLNIITKESKKTCTLLHIFGHSDCKSEAVCHYWASIQYSVFSILEIIFSFLYNIIKIQKKLYFGKKVAHFYLYSGEVAHGKMRTAKYIEFITMPSLSQPK